ncbi:MAG: hypothetical protein ALAOOOJD_04112 [bacterium]|nr:hypothetical protein [bacterium]
MIKLKTGAWLAMMLTIVFTTSRAPAQWSSLKPSLQEEVKILAETKTRLVLFQEASGISLILTPAREPDADIYGDFEARRGGNPYRVWVVTEKLSTNPQFVQETGKKFFKASFLKTLRWEVSPEFPQTFKTTDAAIVPDSNGTQAQQATVQNLDSGDEKIARAEPDSLPHAANQDTAAAALVQPAGQQTQKNLAVTSPVHEAPPRRGKEQSGQRFTLETGKASPIPTPTEAAITESSLAQVDSLYQSALTAMEQKDWRQAALALERIQLLQPDYKDAADRLARVRASQELAEKPAGDTGLQPNDGRHLFVGGAIVTIGAFIALIVLPFIGVLMISQTIRAQYHIFRGHYLEAAQIYERLLARRPDRKKVISALATLYLRLGRRDEAALKVYEKALQLNLIVRNHAEINSIVSQYYLNKGRTDPAVIEVLEDALKAERLKQKPRKS